MHAGVSTAEEKNAESGKREDSGDKTQECKESPEKVSDRCGSGDLAAADMRESEEDPEPAKNSGPADDDSCSEPGDAGLCGAGGKSAGHPSGVCGRGRGICGLRSR